MTPMIDMTFQLIAFFMFAINFNSENVRRDVELPLAELAQPVDPEKSRRLFLNFSENGSLLAPDGPMRLDAPEDLERLRKYLGEEVERIRYRRVLEGEDFEGPLETTVVIRGHRMAPSGSIQEVVREARDAGFRKFSLRALREAPE